MPGSCAIYRSWITGDTLTASDLTTSFTTVGVTNATPQCLDDYSTDVTQMGSTADPYPGSVASLATSTAGELERLRHVIKQFFGWSQWYAHTEPYNLNRKVFINDTANANMTLGLTINQGAADDYLLTLKSSDIAHVMTGVAETDTFGSFGKNTGVSGGLQITGYRDADSANSLGLELRGYVGQAANSSKTTTAVGLVTLVGAVTDAGTGVTEAAANGNILAIRNDDTTRFIFDADGEMHMIGSTTTDSIGNGTWFLNDTANSAMTLGVTLNQGANDNEILAFKSSDIDHALTAQSETDTYAAFFKNGATAGGLTILSIAENSAGTGNATLLGSYGLQAEATKTTASRSLVEIYASQHDGANTLANITADGNIFGVRCRRGGANVTVFIVDEDGDIHHDGTAAAFDEWDDVKLMRALDYELAPEEVVRTAEDDAVAYTRTDLVSAGLLKPTVEGERPLLSMGRTQRLAYGAVWQLHKRVTDLEAKLTTVIGTR